MTHRQWRRAAAVFLLAAATGLAASSGRAAGGRVHLSAAACTALNGMSIPASAIGLPTGGAIVQAAEQVAADAPKSLVATDGNKGASRSRPLCEYPSWPKFTGAPGTEDQATSFTCTDR